MFGINSFEQVGQIAEGHFKEITKQENELYEFRIKICRKCPLFSEGSFGPYCDSKKCIDKNTHELTYGNFNAICGCGCRLKAKLRLKKAHCVLEKW